MIINTEQGDIEVIGDIKEFKTSIDPKNLEFITTLLSSNLYSDPEQSFIREIVSNAWDSHVEANTTDTPVIIKFSNSVNNKSLTIRDYGTGLSPERFKEVYCNIGSSTKRESNDFIGGFGIGKYSSLACSNTVYITSYYEGIAYYYLMVKSGNTITTNLLSEQPTTEKNGVEITIRNIESFTKYYKALDFIIFFPNIYVDGFNTYINSSKIKRFTNFAACNKPIDHKLLLGNVLYPCNTSLLPADVKQFITEIQNTGIVISFDIGELGVTPNRENIIYTSTTIDIISDKIRKAKDELYKLIEAKICKDYTDIVEYFNIMNNVIRYDPISDTLIDRYGYYMVRIRDINCKAITYKGKNLNDSIDSLGWILRHTIPNYRAVVCNDKVYTSDKVPWDAHNCIKTSSSNIVIVENAPKLYAPIKLYLKTYYAKYVICNKISKKDVETFIADCLNAFNSKSLNNADTIIDAIYDHIISKAKLIDFNSDPHYKVFEQNLKSSKVSLKVNIKDVILYIVNDRIDYRQKRTFSTLKDAVQCLKNYKKGIILLGMEEDEFFWKSVARFKDFIIVKSRKDILTSLNSMQLRCVVNKEKLLYKDSFIDKVYTLSKYLPIMNSDASALLDYTIDDTLYEEFKTLISLNTVPCEYRNHCIHNGKEHPYTKYLCEKLTFYLNACKEIIAILKGYNNSNLHRDLATALIIKTKSFKVNARAYNNYRNNLLLQILCQRK